MRQLAKFSPPNVGVVGPTCKEGNSRILTHDFVHKTHLHIFGVHYPPVLMDWWMDDWISQVYSRDNTRRLSKVLVVHHTDSTSNGEMPTRYSVDYRHERFLPAELRAGRAAIRKFISEWCSAGGVGNFVGVGSYQPCALVSHPVPHMAPLPHNGSLAFAEADAIASTAGDALAPAPGAAAAAAREPAAALVAAGGARPGTGRAAAAGEVSPGRHPPSPY